MAIVVEDGTGLANANSLASVADADAYHTLMGNTTWTGATPAKETALIIATQFFTVKFGTRWDGRRLRITQSLDWPRYDVYDRDGFYVPSNIVPVLVKNAICELALFALTEDIYPNITNPGTVLSKTIEVGPIKKSTTYKSPQGQLKMYRLAMDMIAEYVSPAGTLERS